MPLRFTKVQLYSLTLELQLNLISNKLKSRTVLPKIKQEILKKVPISPPNNKLPISENLIPVNMPTT
jgi:hypothetical protein